MRLYCYGNKLVTQLQLHVLSNRAAFNFWEKNNEMRKFSRAGKRDLAEMLRTEIVFPRNKISFCVVAKELCFHNHSSACFHPNPEKLFGELESVTRFQFPSEARSGDPVEFGELQVETRFQWQSFFIRFDFEINFLRWENKNIVLFERSGVRGWRRNKSSELFFFSLFCSENLFF